MSDLPFVSIVIPARNEEKFIGKCIESILNGTYPKDKLEIIVVDGMSEDRTEEIVDRYKEEYPSLIKFGGSLHHPFKKLYCKMCQRIDRRIRY